MTRFTSQQIVDFIRGRVVTRQELKMAFPRIGSNVVSVLTCLGHVEPSTTSEDRRAAARARAEHARAVYSAGARARKLARLEAEIAALRGES